MKRTHLLGAVSAAALALAATGAYAAAPQMNGGGSTLAQFVYGNGAPNNTPTPNEFNTFNTKTPPPPATFGTYWESGSGAGQMGFLTDNLTCVIQKAQGSSSTCTGTPGGANTQHYGASDATLSSTQISSWSSLSFGQAVSGNLIQLPTIGVGVTVPVNNPVMTKNYVVTLSDNDLCGVFSGLITDFSQITDSPNAPQAGPITVIYRSDGSGTTFLLTNHLADSTVCNAGNTAAGVTFVATTTFVNLFSGSIPPANFHGEQGSSGIANAMSGLGDLNPTQLKFSVSYLTPDLTSVASATSNATLSNGKKSQLKVAAITSGSVTAGKPTVNNIKLGLAHVVHGTNPTPPSNATDGANPALWVPTLATVSQGYPIVGYTTMDFAQCYASSKISSGLIQWLKLHYQNSAYKTVQTNNGFVPVTNSKAAPFVTAIVNHILSNSLSNNGPWNTNIENRNVCKANGGSTYPGR